MEENLWIIEKGDKMKNLLKSQQFQELFITDFIDSTTTYVADNYHTATAEQREKMNEKMIAIGVFKSYINNVIDSGEKYKEYVDDINKFEGEMYE